MEYNFDERRIKKARVIRERANSLFVCLVKTLDGVFSVYGLELIADAN